MCHARMYVTSYFQRSMCEQIHACPHEQSTFVGLVVSGGASVELLGSNEPNEFYLVRVYVYVFE